MLQRPSSPRSVRDLAGHEPSIANECGRHSVLVMDVDGAMLGTIKRPKGWVPDSPIVPLAQKICSATASKGEHGLATTHSCCNAHNSAKPHIPGLSPAPLDALPIEGQTRQEPPHGGPYVCRMRTFFAGAPQGEYIAILVVRMASICFAEQPILIDDSLRTSMGCSHDPATSNHHSHFV